MNKNITLSADETLLQLARRRATQENRTLNNLFQEWLEQYVGQPYALEQYDALMNRLAHIQAGCTFIREEMNERC